MYGRVTRVVDADTYDVLTGGVVTRVRLLDVDAPELLQPFGRQAADSVRSLIGRQLVLIAPGASDRYGRRLARVWLLTLAGQRVALDSMLVARGWAWATTGPSGHTSGGRRAAQQLGAQLARRGLWKCAQVPQEGAPMPVPPWVWRAFNAENKRRFRGTCTW